MGHGFIRLGLTLLFAVLPLSTPDAPVAALGAGPGAANRALRPTKHPPLPADLASMWLVPDSTSAPLPASTVSRLAPLRGAIELVEKGEHARALASLDLKAFQGTPLADHAAYYRAVALLQLSRPAEARELLAVLRKQQPEGFLTQAILLKAAEAAEAEEDHDEAVEWYAALADQKTTVPDVVLHRLGHAALAAGDRERAAKAFGRLYYEFPLSDLAASARTALKELRDVLAPPTERFRLDLGRAERLYGARRFAEARDLFAELRNVASGGDRELVALRLAQCDFHLRRYAAALNGLQPLSARGSRQAEARFFYLTALRARGRHQEYVQRAERLIADFPDAEWAEETLKSLGTHYIVVDEEGRAAEIFAELYRRFPGGRHAERAAWKAGWWAYRRGELPRAVEYFESAAAMFPRSDYRPAYLHWAGRAHERLGNRGLASERYALVVADYGGLYYGRLAARRVGAASLKAGSTTADAASLKAGSTTARDAGSTTAASTEAASSDGEDEEPFELPPLPPTAPLIQLLIALELYGEAVNEIRYAQQVWGDSPALGATLAYVYNRQGELRRAINAMKRAYPQYMTAAGADLPLPVRKVIFPLDYWPLIQKYAGAHRLDPFLMAALVAQESTFDPKVRSSANAYGLMQIIPSTARRLARRLGIRFRTGVLTDPTLNVRMGMRHFADLIERFKQPHLALAAYNAGEHRVARWLAERRDLGLAVDEFIDDIPFPETQNYVKRILGTAEDYRRLYGGS